MFFFKLEKIIKTNNIIYLNCVHLFNALLTLIIFLILWNYDIQLVSLEIILAYKNFIYYYFFFMVFKLLLQLIKGIYKYIKFNEINDIYDVLKIIFKFINFLVNINIIMFKLQINFFIFLQYNIIFLIVNINMIIFFLHKWWLNCVLEGTYLTNFISYPLIPIIIIYILYWLNYENGYKLADLIIEYCSWYVGLKIENN